MERNCERMKGGRRRQAKCSGSWRGVFAQENWREMKRKSVTERRRRNWTENDRWIEKLVRMRKNKGVKF